MFELFASHFHNADKKNFDGDLAEKPWVILLESRDSGEIRGFSTLSLMNRSIDGIPVKVVFSGDTIIHRDYWGGLELPRVWLDFVYSHTREDREARWYWYLISKGYKTYRFLPVYFYHFYPRYDRGIPAFEQKLLDAFAEFKFPGQYDPETGVIKTCRDYLKPGVAEVTSRRLKDPHIKYFVEKNPGYYLGDELACIAELSETNLKPFGHRLLKGCWRI
ncbi:hypothetical protein SY88_13380 [Clostridiales bacterium PH28_bin88]|nr:hypothetical protein SY88_13380 [Clostridiales bacterium PH28_bin88]